MKRLICDKCCVAGRENKRAEGPVVASVRAGLENGGRILDLCGDCRKAFHALVDGWLITDGRNHIPDPTGLCSCGSLIVSCQGCAEERCLTCDPYTEYERLNRCCVTGVSLSSQRRDT